MIGYTQVGKVSYANGLKGDVEVLLFSKSCDWLTHLQKSQAPVRMGDSDFRCTSIKSYKDGLKIHLEGIEDRNAAEALRGLSFAISSDLLKSKPGESVYLGELVGFTVVVTGLEIGCIESFSSNGPQDLLVLKRQGFEVLIPFVNDFIETIDFENKKLVMSLPEGLLDVNMNSDGKE